MPSGAHSTLPADFFLPVRFLKGVGPRREKLLERLGVRTAGDLLLTLPRDYRLYRVVPAAQAAPGEQVALSVMLKSLSLRPTRRGQLLLEAEAADPTGRVRILWFNQPYVMDRLREGMWLLVEGRVRRSRFGTYLEPEHWEAVSEEEGGFFLGAGRREFVRVQYPLTEGLTQRLMRSLVEEALRRILPGLADPVPEYLRRRRKLPPLGEAFRMVHRPPTPREAERGRRRLAYDEFLLFQTAMMLRRHRLRQAPARYVVNLSPEIHRRIRRRLPFTLTGAQERAVAEIARDLASGRPMNRLLQGDVGTGKTAVAFYAVLACVARRLQAVVLAPTEILAEQHYGLFRRLLEGSRVRLALLTSSVRGAARKQILAGLAEGSVDVLVGTHAVMEKGVRFRRLALAVMDEQHRFGVLQRKRLRAKGTGVHTLLMTATPIPRTLALTLYGDLDVSVLDEFPPGRGRVSTRTVEEGELEELWRFVAERAGAGERAYVICPLVEESRKSDLVAATALHRELSRGPLKHVGVGLLHGRMPWREKERVLERLRRGEVAVLVSTVVVEVGIDVPEATVMVVEHAERFGLAQLHQLRGRIGRGRKDAWFFMVVRGGDEAALERIRVMERTRDGFAVAEEDFRLRGPGEFFGTRQHGEAEFVVADLVRDLDILSAARQDARELVQADPGLQRAEHRALGRRIMEVFRDRLNLVDVG